MLDDARALAPLQRYHQASLAVGARLADRKIVILGQYPGGVHTDLKEEPSIVPILDLPSDKKAALLIIDALNPKQIYRSNMFQIVQFGKIDEGGSVTLPLREGQQ